MREYVYLSLSQSYFAYDKVTYVSQYMQHWCKVTGSCQSEVKVILCDSVLSISRKCGATSNIICYFCIRKLLCSVSIVPVMV